MQILLVIFAFSIICRASGNPNPDPEAEAEADPQHQGFFPQCGRNERYFRCRPACGDRFCPRRFGGGWQESRCDWGSCRDPGCYCIQGYVRNHQRRCIPERECPALCKENEQWDRCGNECERSCPKSLTDATNGNWCNRQTCSEPTCVCMPGYYRYGDQCVKLEDCPSTCGPTETYSSCGNRCEDTCENYLSGQQTVCALICEKPACKCKTGYYRDSNGQCVRPNFCQQSTCGPTETYSRCGNRCEDTCENYLSGQPTICPRICDKPACKCKSGYYRDSRGQCVRPNFCQQRCGWNEVFHRCAPPRECQAHCGRQPGRNCGTRECSPGCVCLRGFVRNHRGQCVPFDRCHMGGGGGGGGGRHGFNNERAEAK